MTITFTKNEIEVLKVVLDSAYHATKSFSEVSYNILDGSEIDSFTREIYNIKQKILD